MAAEVGARLRICRNASGVTQAQVAEVLGLDASAVSRIEAGGRQLTAFELGLLAASFNWDPRELLGIERPRPKLSLAARLREVDGSPEHAFGRMAALVEVDSLLDQAAVGDVASGLLVEFPRPVPTSEGAAAKDGLKLAELLREKLGVSASIPDLIGFAEHNLGLDVLIDDLPGECDGAVAIGEHTAIAVLDGKVMSGRQRFTLAHEIGHAIAGDAVESVHVDRCEDHSLAELRADAFAAELLMPADAIRPALGPNPGAVEFVEAMVTYGVSWTALRRHCHDLGISIPGELRGLEGEELFALAGRDAEVGFVSAPIPRRIPSRLARRVRKAFSTGIIGAGTVGMVYGVQGVELENLLASLPLEVPVPEPVARTVTQAATA